MNIKELALQLEKLKENQFSEVDSLNEKNIKINWRKYSNEEENFLSEHFNQYRNEFLNQFEPLQKGRIKSYMNQPEDSISPSNFANMERLFLYGWKYENGHLTSEVGNMYKNETKIKYMKFLCENVLELVIS